MVSRGRRTADRPELEYVLLCLIRMHDDTSGYQLGSFVEQSTGYLYRAHLSQIYPALKRLHADGLVTFTEVVREGKPNLKLYRITQEGISASESWLRKPYSFEDTRDNADRFFMRLVFMGHLEPDQVLAYIDAGIEAMSSRCTYFENRDLDVELSFLTDEDPAVRERYRAIWECEVSFLHAEYALRIDRLRKLREQFAGSMDSNPA